MCFPIGLMFYFERTYTNYSIGKGKIVCMGRRINTVTSHLVNIVLAWHRTHPLDTQVGCIIYTFWKCWRPSSHHCHSSSLCQIEIKFGKKWTLTQIVHHIHCLFNKWKLKERKSYIVLNKYMQYYWCLLLLMTQCNEYEEGHPTKNNVT